MIFDYPSPIGLIRLHWTDEKLSAIQLCQVSEQPITACGRTSRNLRFSPGVTLMLDALDAYFRGKPVGFSMACLDLTIQSAFRRHVYSCVFAIPFGQVRTYGEIAAAVEKPGGAQAVGQAINANPFPIVIPCHRVVAGNGIGGFSAGLHWKRALLRHEGIEERNDRS